MRTKESATSNMDEFRELAKAVLDYTATTGKTFTVGEINSVGTQLNKIYAAADEYNQAQKAANQEKNAKVQKAKASIVEENTPYATEEDLAKQQEYERQKALEAEKERAEESLQKLDESDLDWTDASARKANEQARKQLQAQIDSAGASLAKEEDSKAISSMSEEDKKQLERYAVSQVEDQNKPVELSDPNFTLFLGLFGNQPNAVTGENFTDLFGKVGGKTRTDELAETYMREQNAELNEKAAEAGKNFANAGRNIDDSLLPEVSPYDVDVKPVTKAGNDLVAGALASAASVPVNAVAGAVGTVGQLQSAARSTGRYGSLDPNATGTALQTYSSAIRDQVGENLTGDIYDENGNLTKDGGLLGDTMNLMYQVTMNFADTIARAYIGGGSVGGSTLAGLNTFSQTMAEASEKGATPAQAVLLATSNAFVDAITEKIPLDKLISVAKGKDAISLVKNVIRQAGLEITEEELSLVGSLAAEAAILGEKSDFSQTVAALKESGMSEAEAKEQAWKGIWDEAVQTALVSGLAGGLGGLSASLKGQYADPGEDPSKGITKTPEPLTEKNPWDSLYETSPEAQAETDTQKKQGDLKGVVNDGKQPDIDNAKGTTQQRTIDDILEGVVPKNQEPVQAEAPSRADEIVNKTLEDIGLKKPEAPAQEAETPQFRDDMTEDEFLDAMGSRDPRNGVEDPMADRNYTDVGKRNVNAYQYENPEVKPYFQEQAAWMLSELQDTVKGERGVNAQTYYESGGENGYYGNKRLTSDSIAELRDQYGMSYNQIEQGLYDIIQDAGSENNAVAKRIEFVLNDRLMNGYTDFYTGKKVEPNADYLNMLKAQQSGSPTVEASTQPQKPATQPSTPQVDTSKVSAEGGQDVSTSTATELTGQTVPGDVDTSTLGKQSAPSGDYEKSKSFTNSGAKSADEDIRNAYQDTMRNEPNAADYEVKHNADVKATAQERTATPEKVRAEADYLIQKKKNGMEWTAEDELTATYAIKELFRDGSEEAIAKRTDIQQAMKLGDTNRGQVIQIKKVIGTMKDIESPMTAADTFTERMYDMKEKDTTYNPKQSGGRDFETWRKEVVTNVTKIAADIDKVPDGDTAAMKAIIEDIAYQSGISGKHGQYGLPRGTKKTLDKVSFEDLKILANAQVASMSDVYRKRSASELAESSRKSAMLSAITTFERNLTGNTAIGLLDSASDSTSARIMDGILSKFTGKQTVGNDIKNIKQYVQGALDAARWASLCVELNVPVEMDAMSTLNTAIDGGNGGKYVGKTFTPDGNVVMRGLYAYQKFQSYELDVSDKIFEGGTKSAVSESLKNLKGLSADEQQRLADYTANRRTFKDATWTDESGDTHGAVASRLGQWVKNGIINLSEKGGEKVGGIFGSKGKEVGGNVGKTAATVVTNKVAPFVSVPTNVAQAGVDYSTGIIKGAAEMALIIHDARNGIDIPVERQRQAASDFGRGVSGLGLIGIASAAAKAGIIAVHNDDDYDKKSLEQSEGLTGAQINLSALGRLGEEGGEKWRSGDVITSLDFLEPFNTHLYLGAELAQYDDMWSLLKNYSGSVFEAALQAFTDSPMVSGLQELQDDIDGIKEGSKSFGDFAAENLGEYVSSYEPQIVRQAAQSIDGYYRDTRGDTAAETAFNQLIAGIPYLSKTLPKKVDGLGNEQERPGWLSTFFDPTKTKTYNEDDVTAYLGTLSESTGDTSFYPDRQSPKTIKIGGEEIALDGSQRETYQKAYGGSVDEMYSALMNLQGFKDLPGDVQSAALKKAEAYATEIAKASIANNPDAPEKTAEELANSIYVDTVKNTISNAFKAISEDAKYGRDNADSIAALEQAYSNVSLLPENMQEEILEDSGGRLGYYATAKKNGVSTETFLNMYNQYKEISDNENLTTSDKAQDWSVALDKAERNGTLTSTQKNALKEKMVFRYSMQADTKKYDEMRESGISIEKADQIIDVLDKVVGTGKVNKETGEASVRPIDKYTAITNVIGLTDAEIDAILEDYMPDYDPEDDSPDKTYLKYDYVRQQLGISPEGYIDIYNVYLDGGKKAEVISNWKNLGYDSDEANILYRLFKATGKTKIDVESWYAEQTGQRSNTTSTDTAKSYPGETIKQGSLDDFGKYLIETLYGTTK